MWRRIPSANKAGAVRGEWLIVPCPWCRMESGWMCVIAEVVDTAGCDDTLVRCVDAVEMSE